MKTTADLNALASVLINLMFANFEIGDTEDPASNSVDYEENGWSIGVDYDVYGKWSDSFGDYWTPESCDLENAWGEVTGIEAYHCDEETGEETEFSEEDVDELWGILNKAIESMA